MCAQLFSPWRFHAFPPPLRNIQLKEMARSTGYGTTHFLLFAWIMAGGTWRPLFRGLVKLKKTTNMSHFKGSSKMGKSDNMTNFSQRN